MAENLQNLIDKINREGIRKADEKASLIIADAEKRALAIVEEARARADEIRTQAEKDEAALRERSAEAIRQTARDAALALGIELKRRVETAVQRAAAAALTPEFMTEIIRGMVRENGAESVAVRVSSRDAGRLEELLLGALKEDLRERPAVFADRGITSGMRIAFNGDDMYCDFTADAVTELLKSYAGDRLAAVLDGGRS